MKLTLPQFRSEEECRQYLESVRWPSGVESPFDKFSKVYTCKGERFRCRNTGKYFNVRTGTVFSNSRLGLVQWMELFEKAQHGQVTPKAIAQEYGISLKSAYATVRKIETIYPKQQPAKETVQAEQFTLSDWLFHLKN